MNTVDNRDRPVRWYDLFPTLAEAMRRVVGLPEGHQNHVGTLLHGFLDGRSVAPSMPFECIPTGKRLYDKACYLKSALDRLRFSPVGIQEQSASYMMKLVRQAEKQSA